MIVNFKMHAFFCLFDLFCYLKSKSTRRVEINSRISGIKQYQKPKQPKQYYEDCMNIVL